MIDLKARIRATGRLRRSSPKKFAARIRIRSGIDSIDGLSTGMSAARCCYKGAGETRSIKTDAVYYAWAGSATPTGSAEELSVEIAAHIKVDKYLRTNVPKLYAAGDVTGQ
jgi:pyruvate/2-oxoglutarate dehydrogenase complex dihydrolipoamide dehydrogenase (E3) component